MKKKIDYCFLILHYRTYNDTKYCVDSILKNFSKNNIKIIIVDNGSNNNSGEKLEKRYNNNELIDVLINKENLGFSGGNNLGFKYIKNNYNTRFIIMINNDTYIIQKDFLNLIEKSYKDYSFAVLGPKIILKDNKIFKMNERLRSKKEIISCIKTLKINLFLNDIFLYNILKKIKSIFKKQILTNEIYNPKEIKSNVVIHGCCMIFSKKYIEKFDGLSDKTFLYGEEELLYIRLKQYNLISVYNPLIEIHHNEDSATNSLYISNRKKNDFVFRNQLKANIAILNEINNLEDSKNEK